MVDPFLRILLIEDNPADVFLLREMLTEFSAVPFSLTLAERLAEGLLRLSQETFDVVLLDLGLPDSQGLETLMKLRAQLPHIPTLVLTGLIDEAIGLRALQEGAQDYLVKGQVEGGGLARAIRYAIERQHAEQALRESEERFRQVVVSISDHIYVTEVTAAGGLINRYLSPHVESLTGYNLENFISDWRFWPALIHPADREAAAAQVQRLHRGRSSEVEYRLTRADGEIIWVRDSARIENNGDAKIIYGVVSNITARKQAEEAQRRYIERLRNLREIDLDILSARSPAAIVQTTLKRLRQLIPCRQTSVTLFDMEKGEAVVFAAEGDQTYAGQFDLAQPLEPNWGDALERNQPWIVTDTLAVTEPAPLLKMLISTGIRSCLNIPLLVQGKLIGVVNLAAQQVDVFKPEQMEVGVEVANQLAIALHQARLYEQVSNARERLEALSRRLLEAQETERRHIARELHDEIGQNLSLVKIDLQTIQHLPQAAPLASHLIESISTIDQAMQRVRTLSVELRPALLDDLGLVPALRWYVDRQAQRGGFAGRFVAGPLESRLAPELETVCYRITQEALTNVLRYAQARQVEVELQQHEAELWLVIRDDGPGFDVPATLKQAMRGASLGLLSMQERALLVGGQLDIESAPGQGTVIRARLPLKYTSPAKID